MSDKSTATPAPPAEKHVGEPYPKMLYKAGLAPKPQTAPDPPVEVQTLVVNNEEDEKKATSDGWSEHAPKSGENVPDRPTAPSGPGAGRK